MSGARPPRAEDLALVLRRFRYRESSLVCHLLTPEHGRVSVLAKGAYRPRSAYSGVLDLFDTLRLGWSPGSDLASLRTGAIERRRRHLSRDLGRYRAGLRVLELARLGARERHEERELFAAVEAALDALEAGGADPCLVTIAFDLCFLRVMGLAPALESCARCGTAEPGASGTTVQVSAALGGRLCEPCTEEVRAGTDPERFRGRRRARPLIERVPAGLVRVAASLAGTPMRDLGRIRFDPARSEALRGFVGRFLEYHLETRPRVRGPRPRAAAPASARPR